MMIKKPSTIEQLTQGQKEEIQEYIIAMVDSGSWEYSEDLQRFFDSLG